MRGGSLTPHEPLSDRLVHESATPFYAQLEEIFRTKISTGEWAQGERIPSENELSQLLGVSRVTVRGALTKLADQGLLVRVAGKGTFVAKSEIHTTSPAYHGVRERLEAMGLQTTTEMVGIVRTTPSESVQHKLRLSAADQVYAVERVRRVRGEPISLHHSFVPVRLAPTLDDYDPASEQLCGLLDRHFGLSMKYVDEKLESVSATGDVADRLAIDPGDPVILLEDVIFGTSRTPFEYSRIHFRGDKVQVHFSFQL